MIAVAARRVRLGFGAWALAVAVVVGAAVQIQPVPLGFGAGISVLAHGPRLFRPHRLLTRGHGGPRPDALSVFAVPLGVDPVDGPDDALVTMVEAYEYACPYCEKVRGTLDRLRRAYPREVRIVRRPYIVHPKAATVPALAACAAHLQGKFAAMDALLWSDAYESREVGQAHIEALAVRAGLELDRYRRDLEHACPMLVLLAQADLRRFRPASAPTFFINGRSMWGAQPYEAFEEIIREELTLARERVSAGTRRQDYYRTWILERGLPRFVHSGEARPPTASTAP